MSWTIEIHRALPFAEIEKRQQDLFLEVRTDPARGYLLAFEPLPTYTAGRQASPAELVWNQARCNAEGIDLVPVSRGGKWTYHGPGQIVIYPICHLPSLGFGSRGVRPFLDTLRRSIGALLTQSGIACEEREEPFGLYCGDKKIASFGIQVRHGIVLHGVALYYADQNPMLGGIHPCGVSAPRYTSLVQEGWTKSWETTTQEVLESIKKGFKSTQNSVPLTSVHFDREKVLIRSNSKH